MVSKALDFETRRRYSIYVKATDNIDNSANQRSSQTQAITIDIRDVNDNAPTIVNSGDKPKTILENAFVNGQTIIETVSATDPDDGDNGKVDYQLIASGTNASASWFEITTVYNPDKQTNEGIITLKENLLGKVGVYYVTVKATDRGSPVRLSSNKTLLFEVVDVNLNQPQFVVPQGPQATIQIKEVRELDHAVIYLIMNMLWYCKCDMEFFAWGGR